MPIAVLGVHHAQIMVAPEDEAAARKFYLQDLGWPEVEKPEPLRKRGGFWIAIGEQQLHVGLQAGLDPGRSRAHVAFLVSDLRAAQAALDALGVPWESGEPVGSLLRMELRDPFGNRLELLQRR